MEGTVTLPVEGWNLVLKGLGKLPWEEANPLMVHLQQELTKQFTPPAEENPVMPQEAPPQGGPKVIYRKPSDINKRNKAAKHPKYEPEPEQEG